MTKKAAKKAPKELQNPGACIELAFSSLEIQESLQSYARSKRWAVFDELMNEDSWTFSVGLNKEDLLTATKTTPESDRVEWRSGVAIVQISSAPSSDGFTRTIIRTTFRGYGESADRFAPPKAYWDLATNGSFEAALVSALVAHFKPAP